MWNAGKDLIYRMIDLNILADAIASSLLSRVRNTYCAPDGFNSPILGVGLSLCLSVCTSHKKYK